MQQEFTNIPVKYIDWQLKERKFLYPTYLALELADRTYSEGQHPPYQRIKTARKPKCSQDNLELAGPREYRVRELEKELHAAKKKQMKNEGEFISRDDVSSVRRYSQTPKLLKLLNCRH